MLPLRPKVPRPPTSSILLHCFLFGILLLLLPSPNLLLSPSHPSLALLVLPSAHLQHHFTSPRRSISSLLMTRTSSTTPTTTIFNEPFILHSPSPSSPDPNRRSNSVSSEFALSLGTFETLPASFQPQPSPPTSPNPSPIAYAFPPLAHHSNPQQPHHTSPRKSSRPKTPPVSPGSAARKAKQFFRVTTPVSKQEDKSWKGEPTSAAEAVQARKDKERRKKAEQARPLPYSKKLEIDAFFGEVVSCSFSSLSRVS